MNEREEAIAALDALTKWAEEAARDSNDHHAPENVVRMRAKILAALTRCFPPLEDEDADPVGEMKRT